MGLEISIILFLIGFVTIFVTVDYLLEELEEYLENYNISPVVFGFLVLGIDMEESIASIFGAVEGLPYLSIGNLIGNSIIAITVAFAIPVLFMDFEQEPIPNFYYLVFTLAASNVFISLFVGQLLPISGLIALLLFITTILYSLGLQKRYSKELEIYNTETNQIDGGNFLKESLLVVLLLLIVILSGEIMVMNAEKIISTLNMNESFFGLIIMALITNVEEFWLMIDAIRKDQVTLGISAQVGKIFWNITLIFGTSVLIIGSYVPDLSLIVSGIFFIILILVLSYVLYYKKLNAYTAIFFVFVLALFFTVNIGFEFF